jgi:hypothetical protein
MGAFNIAYLWAARPFPLSPNRSPLRSLTIRSPMGQSTSPRPSELESLCSLVSLVSFFLLKAALAHVKQIFSLEKLESENVEQPEVSQHGALFHTVHQIIFFSFSLLRSITRSILTHNPKGASDGTLHRTHDEEHWQATERRSDTSSWVQFIFRSGNSFD